MARHELSKGPALKRPEINKIKYGKAKSEEVERSKGQPEGPV